MYFVHNMSNKLSAKACMAAAGACKNVSLMGAVLGGDVNIVYGYEKRTALMLACLHGDIAMMRTLMAVPGIDVDKRDRFGRTAVHYTCIGTHDDSRVTELLALHRADMTASNRHGSTFLHLAAYWGCARIVSFLLTLPEVCDTLAVRDKWGRTAEGEARSLGHIAIADMIATAKRRHKMWKSRRSFLDAEVFKSRMQVTVGAAKEGRSGLCEALLDGRLLRHSGMKYVSRLGGKVALFM